VTQPRADACVGDPRRTAHEPVLLRRPSDLLQCFPAVALPRSLQLRGRLVGGHEAGRDSTACSSPSFRSHNSQCRLACICGWPNVGVNPEFAPTAKIWLRVAPFQGSTLFAPSWRPRQRADWVHVNCDRITAWPLHTWVGSAARSDPSNELFLEGPGQRLGLKAHMLAPAAKMPPIR
jgi:hypothetical protein